MTKYNYIYSVLTKGLQGYRKCVYNGICSDPKVARIIDALIPVSCTDAQRAWLAELYIHFIKTDAGLNVQLSRVDPYNSYDSVAFDITPESSVNIEDIANSIKLLNLNTCRFDDPVGYIMQALASLLNICEV